LRRDTADLHRQAVILRPFIHGGIINRDILMPQLMQQKGIKGRGNAAAAIDQLALPFIRANRGKGSRHLVRRLQLEAARFKQ